MLDLVGLRLEDFVVGDDLHIQFALTSLEDFSFGVVRGDTPDEDRQVRLVGDISKSLLNHSKVDGIAQTTSVIANLIDSGLHFG